MLQHPGIELSDTIKEKGLTQKAFSIILGKKVSEVNELLKGKRNITIQRDFLLHKTLGTPIKYRILKQVDYEYSLLDIEENEEIEEIEDIEEKNEKAEEIEEIEDIEEKNEKAEETKENNKESKETNEKTTESDEEFQNRLKIFRSF